MEEKYRIAFQVGDVRFEIEGTDKSWIEEKEKYYLEKVTEKLKKPPAETIEPTKEIRPTLVPQYLTINEFYQKYIKANKITSRPNIGVFFVYYLQKVLKKEEVKTQDVLQCFADISYPNYNKINMTDVLNQGKRKALLNYVNNNWSLTLTGEDFVLNSITSEA
jgi:hypothetical protein